ncbi:MAG: hypothetical protein D6712_21820, partial [Chloroflexi bacterium]
MSSFLSKRIEEQKKKAAEEAAKRDAEFRGLATDDEEGASAEPAGPVGQPDEGEVLPSGYIVPPKLRMPPKIAKLRKQLRSKLLAYPDEADHWHRGMKDKEELLIGRLKTVLQKMGVSLSQDEFRILAEGLLNDLLGFGAIEPLVQDKRYSEIMVNGPEIIFAEFKGKLQETQYVFDDEEHVQWT